MKIIIIIIERGWFFFFPLSFFVLYIWDRNQCVTQDDILCVYNAYKKVNIKGLNMDMLLMSVSEDLTRDLVNQKVLKIGFHLYSMTCIWDSDDYMRNQINILGMIWNFTFICFRLIYKTKENYMRVYKNSTQSHLAPLIEMKLKCYVTLISQPLIHIRQVFDSYVLWFSWCSVELGHVNTFKTPALTSLDNCFYASFLNSHWSAPTFLALKKCT